ncbi:SDR family oxidoreductase [Pseudodesulfovibrio cashew]|uniref:SDR family oxidoreductase n=1 Tax=Pseudodesulfovibrio cashew TaxID=2678688 RepID=A0A6I6JLS3_9BACT|nr:SDR family oxidoreductase [Pseudodesulfovibrio cashew]
MSKFSLDGRVAIVTGVMGNLGPVWAEALLEAGASVVGFDLQTEDTDSLIAQLGGMFSGRFAIRHADVRSRKELQAVLAWCREKFGPPSILVNNAGIDQPPGGLSTSYDMTTVPFEVCETIFGVNSIGAFQCAQVFGESMIESGGGSIINIGSMYGMISPDSRMYDHIEVDPPFLKPPAYGASKAAVVNFSRYLASHWAPHGVRVNTLSPGGILGGQDEAFKSKFCARVPMGRMGNAEELKGPLVFLASDASSYVTGTEILVDGGYTCW